MTDPVDVVEHEDHWLLPCQGLQVEQIRVSYQLAVIIEGGFKITLETPATLTYESVHAPDVQPVELEPERQEVAAVLKLIGTHLLSFMAFKSGALRLTFDNGARLDMQPHPSYEAWNINGPGGLFVVCLPGGGLNLAASP